MQTILPIALVILTSTPAVADIVGTFREGAPKDRFVIENLGACDLGPVTFTLDLTGSAAGLIFDVAPSGMGVEVYQPFELVAGGERLSDVPVVADGDRRLTLRATGFEAGAQIAFTIDVDDTVSNRQITVDGAEIEGAVLRLATDTADAEGRFGPDARVTVPGAFCGV